MKEYSREETLNDIKKIVNAGLQQRKSKGIKNLISHSLGAILSVFNVYLITLKFDFQKLMICHH